MADPVIPTPLELRDGMIADYAENARRAGGDVAIGDVERIVSEDLRVYDAVERERRAAPPPTFKADPRPDQVTPRVAARGMTHYRRTINEAADRVDPLLGVNPESHGPKFSAAIARVQRIMQPRGNARQPTLAASLEEVAAPKLARKFLHLFLCYQQPTMPVRGNPFADVASPRDRARIMLRKIEDLCDESTATMGPWWVK